MHTLYPDFCYLKIPPLIYSEAKKFIVSTYAGHVLALTEDFRTEFKDMLSTLTDSHQECKVRRKKNIPVDLEGWKYSSQVEESLIKESQTFRNGITLTLSFTTKGNQGVWRTNKGEIVLSLHHHKDLVPTTPNEFLFDLFHILQSLRHELCHVVQTLLNLSVYGRNWGASGLPNSRVKVSGYSIDGYKLLRTEYPPRLPHVLRDIEYYPRLEDEVNKFLFYMQGVEDNRNLRKEAVRLYIDMNHENIDNLYKGENLSREQKKRNRVLQRKSNFFSTLCERQPRKYKDACSKFIKALHDVGYLK